MAALQQDGRLRGRVAAVERPDAARAVIREDVLAVELRHGAAAVDVAAGNGAGASVVGAVDCARELEGFCGRAVLLLVELCEAFVATPAVVAASYDHVDFPELVLADIAQPESARSAVEAVAPGVAEAVRPDLWSAPAA